MKEKIINQLIDKVNYLEIKYTKLKKIIKKKNEDNNELIDKDCILSIIKNFDINNNIKKNNIKNNNNISDDSDDDIDDIDNNVNIDKIMYKENNHKIINKGENNIELKTIINKNEIDSIDDFIKINKYYQNNKSLKCSNNNYIINLHKIEKIINPLIKLKKMVGIEKIKDEIINFVLYYLIYQNKNEPSHMKHISIEGPPGCGKTKLAKIISKILIGLGILENNNIFYAKRTDLIGTHLGETGKKTQNIIDKALGGVLFIDEAYSLGNEDGKDIYSKECIDILTQNLSDNKSKFICIIAGYTEQLERNFFSVNPGLVRRFPFRFKIEKYNSLELKNIFIRKIYKLNWKIDIDVNNINNLFENNYKHFKYFGGDIDTFIQDIKYSHARRIACSNTNQFKIINYDDITKALTKFIDRRNNNENCVETMYL
jgi:SpoVK/Ycf46/Vps4 family AAA+-type ATPase